MHSVRSAGDIHSLVQTYPLFQTYSQQSPCSVSLKHALLQLAMGATEPEMHEAMEQTDTLVHFFPHRQSPDSSASPRPRLAARRCWSSLNASAGLVQCRWSVTNNSTQPRISCLVRRAHITRLRFHSNMHHSPTLSDALQPDTVCILSPVRVKEATFMKLGELQSRTIRLVHGDLPEAEQGHDYDETTYIAQLSLHLTHCDELIRSVAKPPSFTA